MFNFLKYFGYGVDDSNRMSNRMSNRKSDRMGVED